ncbi:hypothetical protein N665_0461s0012 [Sinapis alba]|nr:hypothetical protein N665_0461s0012 [Sinapis alba]
MISMINSHISEWFGVLGSSYFILVFYPIYLKIFII